MALLDALARTAHQAGASDLHLEPGLAPVLRVGGSLRSQGSPVAAAALRAEARRLLPGERWEAFLQRRSADLSRTLGGVRCRLNIFQSARGLGFAVRLLAPFTATLASLNLHPELASLAQLRHGLVLVSGPTGSGKSSTVAALVDEINRSAPRHILTLEQPIEHVLRPRRALIRQREVGRDTPTFAQGLLDALREDPDVIVVGEMRHPETIRLTLNAAETGHLVFTTLHSATVGEALARIVSAFAPEAQPGITAQLSDSLQAVLCQQLVPWPSLGIRVPELAVLRASDPVRVAVRQGAFHKLPSMMQTGGADGQWTRDRYRRWLAAQERFFVPRIGAGEPLPPDPEAAAPGAPAPAPPLAAPAPVGARRPAPAPPRPGRSTTGGVVELDGFDEDLGSILKDL